jgi:hypothetical protein
VNYIEVIKDKHARLQRILSPRIILIGGSNVAFGIDSKKMESELGMPVVNMGLHASLGLTFMLNEVKADIRKGDLIVLSPEYYIKNAEDDLLEQAIAFYPPAESYQPVPRFTRKKDQVKRLVLHIQSAIFKNKEQGESPHIYARESFDDHGDFVAHLSSHTSSFRDQYVIRKEVYSDFIAQMNGFQQQAEGRGARVVFLYPPYARSAFDKNQDAIMFYQQQMDRLLKIRILNQPQTFAYSNAYFFDTIYHLNARGREERTRFIIGILKNELAAN